MAEAFGIAAGAISIAATFTACVDGFQYIRFGREFQRDCETSILQLSCARLRLARWGDAVNVLNDPKLGRPDATPEELQTVKKSLFQIIVLFDDSAKISRKYVLDAKSSGDDVSQLSDSDIDPPVVSLANKLKALATKRQGGRSILKSAVWALYHRPQLNELITSINSLMNDVEELFPAKEAHLLQLVEKENAEIQREHSLHLLEKAAKGVDDILCRAAREASTGHQYLNPRTEPQAKVIFGDYYTSDWKGGPVGPKGPSHVYDRVHCKGEAVMGNQYGGKGFFE